MHKLCKFETYALYAIEDWNLMNTIFVIVFIDDTIAYLSNALAHYAR